MIRDIEESDFLFDVDLCRVVLSGKSVFLECTSCENVLLCPQPGDDFWGQIHMKIDLLRNLLIYHIP